MNRKDFIKSLILAPVTAKVLMDVKPEVNYLSEGGVRNFIQLKPRGTQCSMVWSLTGFGRINNGRPEQLDVDGNGNTRWVPYLKPDIT